MLYLYVKIRKRHGSLHTAFLFWLKANLCVLVRCEALAAVNGLTFGGLEGHLAFLTASRTYCREHFSCALNSILSCSTAVLASLGLVLESLGCIEFLLTCGEHEIIATIFALQCLVLVHGFSLPHLKWYKNLPVTDSNRRLCKQRSPLS